MARSAALNPASTPFFPGGLRGSDADGTISMAMGHQQDRSSLSSLSISPSEYRSAKSSPSPSIDRSDSVRHQTSPGPPDGSRRSPTFRQVDAGRPYPNIESRGIRENSMLGTLDTLPEADDNQENGLSALDNEAGSGAQTPSSFVTPSQRHLLGRERLDTPPVAIAFPNFSFGSGGGGVQRTSASPVSSLGSASQFAGSTSTTDGMAPNFDVQLKTSPFMHDILDRLVRCEYSTREIQRDLNDIQRKVNLLLERALTTNQQPPAQPEFKDPFAASNGSSLGATFAQPRPSMGNIAPNQHAPPIEDMPTITQRLNALTTSVGQLLALQTQQMQQTSHPLEARNSIIGLGPPQDIAPNQIISQPTLSNPSLIGHTLSNRPDLRPSPRQQSNTPMRTWSAGTLDMPIRASESAISRQEPILRDKSRRSVSGLLRRDSSGVSVLQAFIHFPFA